MHQERLYKFRSIICNPGFLILEWNTFSGAGTTLSASIAVNVNLKDSVIHGIERDFTQVNRSIIVDMHS